MHKIFKPRPRYGSDVSGKGSTYSSSGFNPRSREGSDIVDTRGETYIDVSIHAPAKGATSIVNIHSIFKFCFNPRSREGSDPEGGCRTSHFREFQSTLPRRERRLKRCILVGLLKFQSTLPRRERRINTKSGTRVRKFQSTLPRRERPGGFRWRIGSRKGFNPRSREGSDASCMKEEKKNNVSIHAPAKGATHYGRN